MAAQRQDEFVANAQKYAEESLELGDGQMNSTASDTEARLRETLEQLQARVHEQQAALERLRSQSYSGVEATAYASEDPRKKLEQLIAVKDAYQRLRPTVAFLPARNSVLPALLAARTFQQNGQGTKAAINHFRGRIINAEITLRQEEANLYDANLLTKAMEARIERLQARHEDRSQKTSAQLAQEVIATKHAQKERYDAGVQQLGEAMNEFINDYLSPMLAAEELGGPVVGDVLNVKDDTLAAGFTKKGKAKSLKQSVPEKTRQRRIDQIWGSNAAAGIAGQDEEEPPTEAEAADAEMRELIGGLFATLRGAGGGKAYHPLARDSAASRFLVRAKIAQFHPKDANKLRLIDFGREVDD